VLKYILDEKNVTLKVLAVLCFIYLFNADARTFDTQDFSCSCDLRWWSCLWSTLQTYARWGRLLL